MGEINLEILKRGENNYALSLDFWNANFTCFGNTPKEVGKKLTRMIHQELKHYEKPMPELVEISRRMKKYGPEAISKFYQNLQKQTGGNK